MKMRPQRQRKAHGREGGDAPQAKGTKKRQIQGRSPPFKGKGGGNMYIKSFCQPTNPGKRQGGKGYKGRKRRHKGQGGSQLQSFLPVSD